MLACGSGTFTQSCKNKLDITPEGAPSKGNYWKTPEDAVKGANALYANYDNVIYLVMFFILIFFKSLMKLARANYFHQLFIFNDVQELTQYDLIG